MKPATYIFVSIFVFLGVAIGSLNAQESISIGDDQNQFITTLDREVGQEAIFYGDSLKVVDLNLFKIIESKRLHYPDKVHLSDLTALYLSHQLYLFSNEGGAVYQLVNDSLQRIDKSFSHKMQQGSSIFEYKDEAYRYGGYGFWSFRNFFTNYNISTQGWEIVLPEGSEIFPQGSGNGTLVKIIGDDGYIFGGEEVNVKTPIVFQPNKACWVFHIAKKEWEYLGELNPALVESKHMVILCDNNQILYLGQQKTQVLDLEKNKLETYKNRAIAINLYTDNEDLRVYNYKYKDVYYLLFKLNSQDKNRSLYKRNGIYIETSITHDVVYKSIAWKKNITIGAIAFLFGIILVLIYKKRLTENKKKNQIQILSGKLLYKQRILDLQPQQLDLMQLFIKSKELSSNEILVSIGNDHLHHTQNMRNLHKLIDELNMKLRLLTDDSNDLIKEEKSNIDRRIKIYKINESYFG